MERKLVRNSNEIFEQIRQEAIANDGEYKPQ